MYLLPGWYLLSLYIQMSMRTTLCPIIMSTRATSPYVSHYLRIALLARLVGRNLACTEYAVQSKIAGMLYNRRSYLTFLLMAVVTAAAICHLQLPVLHTEVFSVCLSRNFAYHHAVWDCTWMDSVLCPVQLYGFTHVGVRVSQSRMSKQRHWH